MDGGVQRPVRSWEEVHCGRRVGVRRDVRDVGRVVGRGREGEEGERMKIRRRRRERSRRRVRYRVRKDRRGRVMGCGTIQYRVS